MRGISNRFEGRANTVTYEGVWGKHKVETMPDAWALSPLAIADTTDMWNEGEKREITKVEGKPVCRFYSRVKKEGGPKEEREYDPMIGSGDGMCPSRTQGMVSKAGRKRMADRRRKTKRDEDLEVSDNLTHELKDGGKLDHRVRWGTITRREKPKKEHGVSKEEKQRMKNVTKGGGERPKATERDMDERGRETFRENLKRKILEMEQSGEGGEWGMHVPLVASAEVRRGVIRSVEGRNKERRLQMAEMNNEYEELMLKKEKVGEEGQQIEEHTSHRVFEGTHEEGKRDIQDD